MRMCIVIPTYNEEKTIKALCKNLYYNNSYDYLIVNDGSTDNTEKVLCDNNVPHIGYLNNKGKGYAVKIGAQVLIRTGYTHMLIMDADGQHLISDIPFFLQCLKNHPNSALIGGNRLLNHRLMPLIRYYTNLFMSKVILSFIIGQKVSDSQCGMKLVNLEAFKKLSLKCNRFDFDTELLLEAGKHNLKIKNVPIHTVYHKGRKSKISPLSDTLRFIKLLWRYYGKRT